jgi:hypothetical protein
MFAHAQRVHPELRPTLLVADVSRSALKPVRDALGPDVDLLCCDDLGFDFLPDMRTYYGPLEFCSALKVLGSAHVLRNEDACLFLDPDMLILESLRESVLGCPGDIVVSAHTFAPYPADGAVPDDLEMCLAGHVNGGVFLTRRSANGTPALDWLVARTRYQWFVATGLGMYADQQWFSSLFYYFREHTRLIEDRGVNVAYWNLHERPLREENGRVLLASGEPLRLMHFSGFSSPSGGALSKHSHRRFDTGTEAALAQLIQSYEAELIDAKSRLGYLHGDLKFCRDSLPARLRRAAKRWGVPNLVGQNQTLVQRLRRALRSLLN